MCILHPKTLARQQERQNPQWKATQQSGASGEFEDHRVGRASWEVVQSKCSSLQVKRRLGFDEVTEPRSFDRSSRGLTRCRHIRGGRPGEAASLLGKHGRVWAVKSLRAIYGSTFEGGFLSKREAESTEGLEALVEHLKKHALRTDGPFTLRSGAVSSWYLDARCTTFDGEGAGLVGTVVSSCIPEDVDAVGGMTMGADPIAVACALVSARNGRPMKAFSIRKEAKTHGMGGRLVGPVAPGDRVAILEDTTTTGSALCEAIEVAKASELVVVQALALVDRSEGEAGRRVEAAGVPYRYVLTPGELGV